MNKQITGTDFVPTTVDELKASEQPQAPYNATPTDQVTRETINAEEEAAALRYKVEGLLTAYDAATRYADTLRAEIADQLKKVEEAEKMADKIKKQAQELSKAHDIETANSGWGVSLSLRPNWNDDMLNGFALIHPEILAARSFTKVATIKKVK